MGLMFKIANALKEVPLVESIIANNYKNYQKFGRLMYRLEDFTHSQNVEDIIVSRLVEGCPSGGVLRRCRCASSIALF